MVALVGLVDDVRGGIPILIRLCAQLGAAGLVVWGTGGLTHLPLPEPFRVELGLAAIPLTMFWIVGVTNVYNFLDGIDGYAATQGVIVGITFACLAPVGPIGLVGFAICGGCLGFLPYNWHRAKVFMGDVGSLSLGFLAASLPLQATGTFQADCVFATVLALWFFLADGTFTLTRRLLRGERIWDAHRSHLYQRLVLANRRHDQVARMMAMGATILAALAIVAIRQGSSLLQWSALALAIALMLAFHQITLLAERSSSKPLGSPDGSHDGTPEVSRSN